MRRTRLRATVANMLGPRPQPIRHLPDLGRRASPAAFALVVLLAAAACAPEKPRPEIASSSGEVGYAASYPERLLGATEAFGKADAEVEALTTGYAGYPAALGDDVDPALLRDLYTSADEAGRARAYVTARRDADAVRRFYDDRRDKIRQRVAGAAQAAARDKGCTADVGGAAAYVLDKEMASQAQDRERQGNEAHVLLERHREDLDAADRAKLEEQVDQVAHASYLAHILMVEKQDELRAMLDEASNARQAIDRALDDEEALRKRGATKDAARKASEARSDELRKARAKIDGALVQAQRVIDGADARVEAAQGKQRDRLKALLASLKGGS